MWKRKQKPAATAPAAPGATCDAGQAPLVESALDAGDGGNKSNIYSFWLVQIIQCDT